MNPAGRLFWKLYYKLYGLRRIQPWDNFINDAFNKLKSGRDYSFSYDGLVLHMPYFDSFSNALWRGDTPHDRIGYVEQDELKYVLRILPKNDGAVFIDAGANIGIYALVIAKAAPKSSRIFAIEANPQVYPFLEKNILANIESLNAKNVRPAMMALGNSTGSTSFHCATANPATSSCERSNVRGSRRSFTVPCTTLDDYCSANRIDKIDFIKIDVEGAELFVLQGAKKIFSRHIPAMQIEVNENAVKNCGYTIDELARVLSSYGYKEAGFFNAGRFHTVALGELDGAYHRLKKGITTYPTFHHFHLNCFLNTTMR